MDFENIFLPLTCPKLKIQFIFLGFPIAALSHFLFYEIIVFFLLKLNTFFLTQKKILTYGQFLKKFSTSETVFDVVNDFNLK